jgi:Uma2 family endonuclease
MGDPVLQLEPTITPEAYLLTENDNTTGLRNEFINGLVYAMAGASRDHNRVTRRLGTRLDLHLQGSRCEVFQSDMKVKVKRSNDVRFYYPDLQVSCEEESDRYYNEYPCLIIEVLSGSTQRVDRTEKLLAYQWLESLQEYVLLSQESPYLEIYRRRTDWQRECFSGEQEVILESVAIGFKVQDMYS